MTSTEILAIVSSLFRYLGRERGFLVIQPQFSGAFDQMVQSAEATHVTIRFVRDRGDTFLEVGKEPHWFSPDSLRLMLQGGEPVDAHEDIQEDVSFLAAHLPTMNTTTLQNPSPLLPTGLAPVEERFGNQEIIDTVARGSVPGSGDKLFFRFVDGLKQHELNGVSPCRVYWRRRRLGIEGDSIRA